MKTYLLVLPMHYWFLLPLLLLLFFIFITSILVLVQQLSLNSTSIWNNRLSTYTNNYYSLQLDTSSNFLNTDIPYQQQQQQQQQQQFLKTNNVNEYINDVDNDFIPNVTKYWFNAIVDHFNYYPTIEATFPLRYYVNDQYYYSNHNNNNNNNNNNSNTNNNPVLFYAGNEDDINLFINNCGSLWEIASKINAMIVFAEHRYYGESYPLSNGTCRMTSSSTSQTTTKNCNRMSSLSSPNISYLTVEQAMEDYNTLQVHIRNKWNMTKSTAFIIFGGSYGGNLALWLRLKNANLWSGAIASSATPLKHLLRNSNSFAKIVADVYSNVSSLCPIKIRTGWNELQEKSITQIGRNEIKDQLLLCSIPSIQQTNQSNDDSLLLLLSSSIIVNTIHELISDAFETMVQYGYPYPTSFYNPVPGYPFKVVCERMIHETTTTGLDALRVAAQVYYNYTGQAGTCFDWFPTTITTTTTTTVETETTSTIQVVQSMQRHHRRRQQQKHNTISNERVDTTDWTSIAWDYQCCTEVYQPMPTDGITDIEIPYIPNETQYFEYCQQRWDGVTPRRNWEEMTFWSNNIYAGSNIFLTNGQLDPWRAAGIQSLKKINNTGFSSSSSIIIRTIENGAHHLDLRSSHPLDPPSVITVRQEQLQAIRQWVQEWYDLYSE